MTAFFYAEVINLLSRSNCKLDRLALGNSGFTSNELLECLRHRGCQTLTHLWLYTTWGTSPMVDDRVLTQLTETESPLCPKLADCTFENCCSRDNVPGSLGRMIQSRRSRQGGWLESFKFASPEPLSSEDEALVEQAKADGLKWCEK